MGLGSNIGDTEDNLNEAVARLEKYEGIEPAGWSEIYLTEPQGLKDQQWFTNQVVRLDVDPELWSPQGILSTLLAVEGQMGRKRGLENGPRVIDIDLLTFGDEVINAGDFLQVPHPRMKDRAFVLYPLKDLDPDFVFPDGDSLSACLEKIDFKLEENKIYQD
nr:2-amino-4-hydroxy-6-hydroxymethyldihydropteridine diphosphokinase [Maridesulfovibrio bastinii]